MTVMTWNTMALSTASFTELMQWLTLQMVDVVFLQSTYWSIADLHQGRLQHVRCHVHGHCLDLLNLYQFPVTSTRRLERDPSKRSAEEERAASMDLGAFLNSIN